MWVTSLTMLSPSFRTPIGTYLWADDSAKIYIRETTKHNNSLLALSGLKITTNS